MNNIDFTTQVLQELFIGQWETCGGVDDIVWKDGHSTTENEYSQINTRVAELQSSYDSKEYARERAEAYPSIGDQLDMIFHAGLGGDEFQAAIQAVKDAFPKPTE